MINWEKYLINTDSSDAQIYKKIESALFDLGRFSEVEQFYSRILDKKPNDKYAIVKLANMLNDKGDKEGAIELIDNVINKEDNSIPARLMKIKVLLEQANPADLNDQLDEVIKRIDN